MTLPDCWMPFLLAAGRNAREEGTMQPQGESIWGNINLCIEIALNIYYIVGARGEGIMVPKEHAETHFSQKTVAAGEESGGCLYYPKGGTMDMPLYEMMQKRAAMARKMELAAARQMEAVRERGQVAASALFEGMEPPEDAAGSAKRIREGIYITGGEDPCFAVHERMAEHFLSPYACEFGRNKNGYLYYTLQSAAIPLYELKGEFPECRELVVSEESLIATLHRFYPAYCEQYDSIAAEAERIPQADAPANLFLQEQLDRAQEAEETGWVEIPDAEESEEDDYGEQVDYGIGR